MEYPIPCIRRIWIFILSMLIILDCYFHVYVYYNVLQTPQRKIMYGGGESSLKNETVYYKYPLINGSGASMDYNNEFNSSYYWFKSIKHVFKDLGAAAAPIYARKMPICKLNTALGQILVTKKVPELDWVEVQNIDVSVGGYYAPPHCKPNNRVAIIIPYRDRPESLSILLSYLHPFMKKQLLEYRIFVIEQYGSEKFNKGTLYNIAFLETQRFGTWDCLIFHEVDLVPEDGRISYSCPEHPTLMAPTYGSLENSILPRTNFGGVTAITPEQYEHVNGYSNLYWDWGVEDDDFYSRLESNNYTIAKYNRSVARYAVLPHPANDNNKKRTLLLTGSKLYFQREDLTSTIYNLVNVTLEKLYTHILADVNPMNMPLDSKSLMHRLFDSSEKALYDHEEFKLRIYRQKS